MRAPAAPQSAKLFKSRRSSFASSWNCHGIFFYSCQHRAQCCPRGLSCEIILCGLIFPRRTLPVINRCRRDCGWNAPKSPGSGLFLPLTACVVVHTETTSVLILAKMAAYSLPEEIGSVEDYFKARESFVNAERALGYEGKVNSSDLEVRAQEIVQRIKKWEENNHHGVHLDGSGCEAGHRFLHGQDAIENSKLFKIAQKAPKGALLHCHFDCILPPRTLLDDAKKQDNLYIKTDCPLTTVGSFAGALPQFCVLPQAVDLSDTTNMFSKAYVAGSWMKYSEFLRRFPGGQERAEAWLSSHAVITSDDAYHPHQTVDG